MLKYALQYFDTFCLKLSDNFNQFQFIHTISYTYLHSNITDFPLAYHIRVSSLELYVHRITFSISWQCFVPHNQLLLWSCNIGTAAHLLFTKYPSPDFQEWFGKILYPLKFLHLHPIFILIYSEWFGWLNTIWIWNRKTLLLPFHDFIFPHPSPIILLIWSCHLCCIYFPLFFNIITYYPLYTLRPVGILLVFHAFL